MGYVNRYLRDEIVYLAFSPYLHCVTENCILSEAKGRIKSMSQFMICKSAFDLTQFGGKLINKDEEDYTFFISVVQKHYEEKTYSNIWTIEKIDDYSCEQLVYYLLNKWTKFLRHGIINPDKFGGQCHGKKCIIYRTYKSRPRLP